MFFIILLIASPFLAWKFCTGIFDLMVGKSSEDPWSSSDQTVFNDYSKHTHFHVHSNEKSKEIKKLTDTLEDTIDIEHKEVKNGR